MASTILYVYAITPAADRSEDPSTAAVDGSQNFEIVTASGLSAATTPVSEAEFSQEEIDRRASDLQWLGAVGYRHQAVVSELMRRQTLIPLRAFTLFSSADALRRYLTENAAELKELLGRLEGKEEWTLRLEFDPDRWSAALLSRVGALRELTEEAQTAPPGRAFLLRKKIDEQKKTASREAEEGLVAEIESELRSGLASESITESRQSRSGSFPQINLLLERSRQPALEEMRSHLARRFEADGVSIVLTGPWPPYTFASQASHE